MTRKIQLLRGTTAQNDAFTGSSGEVTVDTTTYELRVHDGSTAGGHIIPKKSECQGLLGGGISGTLLTNSGVAGTVNATSIDAVLISGSANPVSSNAVHDALAEKAAIDSPIFTGTPAAPTVSSATDNSTKIATTAFVRSVLEAIYSVGSTYIGTQVDCPMAAFFGTWTLVGTGIVTNVNTGVSVAGNGNVLGFTSGSDLAYMNAHNETLGDNRGWMKAYVNGTPTSVGDMKVTTNAANSGLQGSLSRTQITVNIWRRTA